MAAALAWSGLRGKPGARYCLLAAAHRDGVVSFWKVPVVRVNPTASAAAEDEDESLASGLAFTLETGTAAAPGRPLITCLHWLALESDFLLVGDSAGRVRMWDTAPASAAGGQPGGGEPPPAVDVYADVDRVKVAKLTDCALEEGRGERLIVAIKGSFLVATLVDATGRTLGTAVKEFHHSALTGKSALRPATPPCNKGPSFFEPA